MKMEMIQLTEKNDMSTLRHANYITAQLDPAGDVEAQLIELAACMRELPVPYIVTAPRISAELAAACLEAGAVRILLASGEASRKEELEAAIGADRILTSPNEIPARRAGFTWDDMKLNSDGMVPVIVQDWQTDQVLMLAYMNRQSYEATLRTGHMVYYSRSRQELWEKGLTSGHFQFVKSLMLDCDNDTILAKVAQLGAACHTGSYSCFFQTILPEEF